MARKTALGWDTDGYGEMKSCILSQILKEEEELNRAFGAGPKLPVPPKAAAAADGEEGPKMTRILLYGNANQCEVAQRMIEEAMDNRVSWRLVQQWHVAVWQGALMPHNTSKCSC